MTHQTRNRRLLGGVATAVVSIALILVVHGITTTRPLINVAVHSTLETAGGMLALTIAAILLWGRRFYDDVAHLVIAGGLVCQGLLDLAHASLAPGPAFFWSRALPTVLGGLVFAAVWLVRSSPAAKRLGLAATGLAVLLLAGLFAWPTHWPSAWAPDGSYVLWAKLLNVGGGVGFFAAAAFFGRRTDTATGPSDSVFAGHCLLFAIAAFAFGLSSVWDATWWLFHILRFIAYVVSLGFVVDLSRRVAAVHYQQSSVEMAAQLSELVALQQRVAESDEPP